VKQQSITIKANESTEPTATPAAEAPESAPAAAQSDHAPDAGAHPHVAKPEHKKHDTRHEKEHKPTHREAELQDRLLRTLADLDNLRKRAARERNEISRRVSDEILLELLPVLDSLERGLESAKKHNADSVFTNGYQMACEQMSVALGKFGVKAIKTTGERFDPARHDAIQHIPDDKAPEGIITTELRKGYFSGDNLLRPAQVVVSSGPAASPQNDASAGKSQQVEE